MAATPPPAAVPESEGVGLGPDGEKIVDSSYYDLLGIKGNADDAAIKKAYRKMAMKFHPDKNPGDDTAAAKFQEISEAYAILSDSNSRAVYNKQGKKSAMNEAGGEEAMPDPGAMFASLFGGKAFEDWIGEISLGKDVSKAFEMSTTEEEREEMKNELKTEPSTTSAVSASPATESTPPAYTAPPSGIQHQSFDDVKTPAGPSTTTTQTDPFAGATASGKGAATTSAGTTTATGSFSSSTPPPVATGASEPTLTPAELAAKSHADKEAKRAEEKAQREKLEAYDRERADEKKERVRVLAQKLRDRIRPFVEARNPGGEGDSESKRFEERIREETGDLALESFGVEICHLIGQIYMSKSSSYLKLHRKGGNILGIKGFFSRLGETTKTLKEGWSFLSVGLEVSRSMQEFEKRQEKGEQIGEEELKKMEEEMSGKMLLVAWKGSKFEVSNVLRQVVDTVLTKESPEVNDEVLMTRAKAIFLTGAILKAVKPSEEDDERRELERMVEEANQKRKDKGKKAKK